MISKRENMLRLQPKSSATDGLNKCKMCLATLDRIATKCCSPTRRGSPPPTGLQHLVISYSLGLGRMFPVHLLPIHAILILFAHWVNGVIVTPRQINLWRLRGGKKSSPLFRFPNGGCIMLFFSHKASFLLTSKKHYNIFRSTGTNSSFGVVIRLHLQVL